MHAKQDADLLLEGQALWTVRDDTGNAHAFDLTEEDAKLFAAAPELLAAAEVILDGFLRANARSAFKVSAAGLEALAQAVKKAKGL